MAVLIVLLQAILLCVSPQRERDEGSQYGKTTMLRAHAGYLERDYVLKPIVNGVGNYYIEAQTRDERRTDVIVDYLGEQFVVELKIWRAVNIMKEEKYNWLIIWNIIIRGKDICSALTLVKQKTGLKEIIIGNKTIVEAVV